jgi:hypothetical protein
MTKFQIWCEVSGGVTGHRQAWLKADGKIQQFDTEAEAQAEADRLQQATNGNPHRKANFSYTVRREG